MRVILFLLLLPFFPFFLYIAFWIMVGSLIIYFPWFIAKSIADSLKA